MAYNDPAVTHADDWDAPILYNGGVTENKIDHSTLSSPLAGVYAQYCRQWKTSVGVTASSRYGLKNSVANVAFQNNVNAVSMSVVLRRAGSVPNSSCCFLIPRYQNDSNYYAMNINLFNGHVSIGGNHAIPGNQWLNSTMNTSIRYTTNTMPSVNVWRGYRFDIVTRGNDVKVYGYYTTTPNTLNAYGEPSWTLLLEAWHRAGTTTPEIILGSLGYDWGSTTPILSGTPNYALGSVECTTNMYMDHIRARRMPY